MPNADQNEMRSRISKLRTKIIRGLKIVIGTIIAALIANAFLKWVNLVVPHSGLLVIRFFGYGMVLWGAIGIWLGIKTASQWGGWQLARTPYNRFLIANLLPLFVSFLFLTPWITIR